MMFSVIFDMDGTLLDTQRICIPAWDWAGERQGFNNVGRCIPDVCGKNAVGWTKYLRDNFPTMDVERFSSDAREYIIKNLVVRYKPGGEELLKFLKDNNVKIAIASGSSRESIEHHLNAVDAFKFFDVIVPGTAVKNGKPAPDIFLLAAQKMGVDPKDCYVIEDSANGIVAGHGAGMKCIGIPDIVDFNTETKAMLTAEFINMKEALKFFKDLI